MTQLELLAEKDTILSFGRICAEMALAKAGLLKDEISQNEAFRLYGRARVQSWRNAGLVTRVKIGANSSTATYSRIELETVNDLIKNKKLK